MMLSPNFSMVPTQCPPLPPSAAQVWVKKGTDALTASPLQRPLLSLGKGTQVSRSPAAPVTGGQEPRVLEPCCAQGGQQLEKFRNVEGTSWRGLVVPLQRAVWAGGGGWLFWEPMLRGAEWMEEGLAAGEQWMDSALQCCGSWGAKGPGVV